MTLDNGCERDCTLKVCIVINSEEKRPPFALHDENELKGSEEAYFLTSLFHCLVTCLPDFS